MSLNYKEIDQILEEASLAGSFLQEIVQFDFHHLIFQFYSPQDREEKKLLISLQPGSLRIHLTDRKRKALAKPPRFTAYLKSHVKGARLREISQYGQERVIVMQLTKGDESYQLYIKLWENNSNLILTDEQHRILDCFSRRPKKGETPELQWNLDSIARGKTPRIEPREFPPQDSFNRQIELFYQQKERSGNLEGLKKEALPLLTSEILSCRRRLERYKKDNSGGDVERLKHQGDLIMANLHRLSKGEKWLDCEDGDITMRIQLDPKLDPWANGEKYYARYKKKRRQLEQQDIPLLEEEVKKLEALKEELQQTTDPSLLQQWLKQNRARLMKSKEPQTGLRFFSGGFEILVGRNARENDELLRKNVRGNDTWLHTRDYHGGYVFIRGPKGKTIPLKVLLDGGNLALRFSKAREADRVDLHYTQVKYLRRAKNGPKGLVIPTQEKNLLIEKDESRLQRLMGVES